MTSSLCGSIGTSQSGQYCVPSLTNSRRRKWCTSVSVPTVDLRPPRLVRCSIATVGGMPKIASTSGREARLHELARVGVERFEVAALALGEQDVEGEGGLARARHAGDHGEAAARDLDVDVLQVVLARLVDADRRCRGSWPRRLPARRAAVLNASSYSRSALPVWEVACAITSAGVPSHTSSPPASPPSGPRSMIQSDARITSRLCSITTSEWPAASSWRKARSSLATSSKCRPVVGSSNRNSLFALVVGLRQVPGELQALRLAAGERRHRLAEAQVFEADVDQRLQAVLHRLVLAEEARAPRRPSARARRRSTCRRSSLRGSRRGSAGRRSPGSAGRRRRGTASRRARSRSPSRSGSGRCRS